jgi:hypothetical protein
MILSLTPRRDDGPPHVLLENLADSELEDRSRRSLERRLSLSGIQKFKPMADFDWTCPKKIERAFTLSARTAKTAAVGVVEVGSECLEWLQMFAMS